MNDLVAVRITGQAITNRYGTLSAGDVLRTDAAFAKHLVVDCGVAEYAKSTVEANPDAPSPKQAGRTKKKA